jgi:hypothetical protein
LTCGADVGFICHLAILVNADTDTLVKGNSCKPVNAQKRYVHHMARSADKLLTDGPERACC